MSEIEETAKKRRRGKSSSKTESLGDTVKGLLPVNGWDVSASKIKVQTIALHNGEVSSKKSKKRKRDTETVRETAVTDENVTQLYEDLVNGKIPTNRPVLGANRDLNVVHEKEPAGHDIKKRKEKRAKRAGGDLIEEIGAAAAASSTGLERQDPTNDTHNLKSKKQKRRKEKDSDQPIISDFSIGDESHSNVSRVLGEIEAQINGDLKTQDGLAQKKKSSTQKGDDQNVNQSDRKRSVGEQIQGELEDSIPPLDYSPGEKSIQEKAESLDPQRKLKQDKKNAKRTSRQGEKTAVENQSPSTKQHTQDLKSEPSSSKAAKSPLPKSSPKEAGTGSTLPPETSSSDAADAKVRLEQELRQYEQATKQIDKDLAQRKRAINAMKADLERVSNGKQPIPQRKVELRLSEAPITGQDQFTISPGSDSAPRNVEKAHGGLVPPKHAKPAGQTVESTKKMQKTAAGHHEEQPSTKKQKRESLSTPNTKADGLVPNGGDNAHKSIQTAPTAKTPIQQKMLEKLVSSRFRVYNEQLYTTPSTSAAKLFREDPAAFETYHAGFRKQVQLWPVNPITVFIKEIQTRVSKGPKQLPKGGRPSRKEPFSLAGLLRDQKTKQCHIADLGCGDATLAASLAAVVRNKKLGVSISSFDLERPKGANAMLVTKADITDLAAAGVKDFSFEYVICCLSLMSTNWVQIVDECARILVRNGEVWVAEVKSRFQRQGEVKKAAKQTESQQLKGKKQAVQSTEEPDWREGLEDAPSNNETDVSAFVEVFRRRGLELKGEVDKSNKMFVSMKFAKTGRPILNGIMEPGEGLYAKRGAEGKKRKFGDIGKSDGQKIAEEGKVLKPCVYKKR